MRVALRAADGSAREIAGWAMILPIIVAAGELGEPELPSPHMLIPLLLGLLAAMTGLVRRRPPAVLNRGAQALLGVLMGTYLNVAALGQVARSIAPLVMVTLATLVICQGAAWAMMRFGGVDRATATLGMIAGESAAAVASAQDLDADGRQVVFMQYLRLGFVVASTPLLLSVILPSQAGAAGPSQEAGDRNSLAGGRGCPDECSPRSAGQEVDFASS
ncbi:AbrB family transcriptional regulator [Sinosporangium siamense]|uniref:AbrB family transcriptional regulator n=1 Tax=Sinosporangium siamense TaxID=1367973 RepID=A0A919RM12_9ACTN|nr:AbrB family transcriptional regulator [Sinosporangium siamense]GII94449.1 hypothetical protein Ssi02_46800 [Sinosporangium siamense]